MASMSQSQIWKADSHLIERVEMRDDIDKERKLGDAHAEEKGGAKTETLAGDSGDLEAQVPSFPDIADAGSINVDDRRHVFGGPMNIGHIGLNDEDSDDGATNTSATASETRRPIERRPSMHRVSSINSLRSLAMNSATSIGSSRKLVAVDGDDSDDDLSMSSDADVDPHTKAFRDAIKSAGTNAFGIIGVDVWLHDENDGSFHHAPGGYWRHPRYRPDDSWAQLALARVEDMSRIDFVPPTKQIPGAGLAGYFWMQCTSHDHHCTWRDIRAITSDPDQPPYLRMKLLEQAGFGKATGVPFDIRGHRGIVLFLARESASDSQLMQLANDCHLRVSADIIGAISARSITQEACINVKTSRAAASLRRIRAKFLALAAFSRHCTTDDNSVESNYPRVDGGNDTTENLKRFTSFQKLSASVSARMRKSYRQSLLQEVTSAVKRKTRVTLTKCKGGGLKPPPPMPVWQVMWTFIGSFITLMVLGGMSDILSRETGYEILLPPFGALLTLQYGLTPAPASQPRNAMYGQIIAISLAQLVKLMTVNMSRTWLRVPLATALAIAFMARLGILHPPAGASAALFASQDRFDGIFFALMLLGNVVAILMAIFLNNLNDKRQYPIYYAFVSDNWTDRLLDTFGNCFPYCNRKKRSREEDLDRSRHELDKSIRMSLREFNSGRQKSHFGGGK